MNDRRSGSIQPRGRGVWQVSAEGAPDPITGKRRRKWKTVKGGRRDADRVLAELQADLATGRSVAGAGTVGEAFEDWWKTKTAHRWEDATSLRHRQDLDLYLMPTLARRKLDELQPADLNRIYTAMADRDLSPRTIQHVHNTARGALNFAVKQGRISRNAADGATVPVRKRVPRFLPTAAQLDRVLELAAAEPTPLWATFYRLSFFTGARPAELCALRWDDLDLEGREVRFDEAWGKSSAPGQAWRIKGTKTQSETDDGERRVSLDQTTVTALRSWRAFCAARALGAGEPLDTRLFVFAVDWLGIGALTPDTVSKRWRRYAALAEVDERVRLYDASRHFHITWALKAGFSPAEVADRVGNSPETIYRFYAHVIPGNRRGIADAIDDALSQ